MGSESLDAEKKPKTPASRCTWRIILIPLSLGLALLFLNMRDAPLAPIASDTRALPPPPTTAAPIAPHAPPAASLGGLIPPLIPDLASGLPALYEKYADELRAVRVLSLAFCATPKPAGFPHTHKCLSTLEEMELLYIGIRERPPANMLEVASASGYSTLWIVSALARNGGGLLHSYDLFKTPFPDVLDPALEARHWRFTQGDVIKVYPAFARSSGLLFDRVLIDAEHTASFGYFYIEEIIQPQLLVLQAKANATAAPRLLDLTVHDIYHFEGAQGVTGEGEVILKWMGYMMPLANIQCLPTFNPIHKPARHAALRKIQRAALGPEAEAAAGRIGQFPHGDLSMRCAIIAEPL